MAKKWAEFRDQVKNNPGISPILRQWISIVDSTITWPATTTTTTTSTTTTTTT
jgi:hypothetical protein